MCARVRAHAARSLLQVIAHVRDLGTSQAEQALAFSWADPGDQSLGGEGTQVVA